jgi:nitrite reductase/ring-hydroxylating ferredoxin subunit
MSGVVQCLRHGARFDVKTGLALLGAKSWLSRQDVVDVESFPVLVNGTRIFIGLPEPP